MTKSQIFSEAHAVARRDRRLDPSLSYRRAFIEALEAVRATAALPADRPIYGFQIIEPSYKRRQYKPLTGQWVAL